MDRENKNYFQSGVEISKGHGFRRKTREFSRREVGWDWVKVTVL
jgi:hypothetical protein